MAADCAPTTAQDGEFTVLTFSATGTCDWTVPANVTVLAEVLIVGGGGGGGNDVGGGGGGGGVVDLTNVAVASGATIQVVVGEGGLGVTGYTPTSANRGSDSSFGLNSAAKGGGAGGGGAANGQSGGSGGGAGFFQTVARTGGAATQTAPGLGNAGGSTPSNLDAAGAGGGGAGGAGADATVRDQGAVGGAAALRSITGSSLGYGGGGGGGSGVAGSPAAGGSGAGTGGRQATLPTPGINGRGGGGGGAGSGVAGAVGGSGVVIVRFRVVQDDGSTPPPWHQAVGRPSDTASCESGWSPSWALWMHGGTGGFTCERVLVYDRTMGVWRVS